jgi:hypothetical protein
MVSLSIAGHLESSSRNSRALTVCLMTSEKANVVPKGIRPGSGTAGGWAVALRVEKCDMGRHDGKTQREPRAGDCQDPN